MVCPQGCPRVRGRGSANGQELGGATAGGNATAFYTRLWLASQPSFAWRTQAHAGQNAETTSVKHDQEIDPGYPCLAKTRVHHQWTGDGDPDEGCSLRAIRLPGLPTLVGTWGGGLQSAVIVRTGD